MSMNAPIGDVPPWTDEDRLVKARTHAGLSQATLADRLGVSERTIKRYEAGGPRKRGLVLGWALACGVNAQWLETGTPATNTNPDGGGQLFRCIQGPWLIEPTASPAELEQAA